MHAWLVQLFCKEWEWILSFLSSTAEIAHEQIHLLRELKLTSHVAARLATEGKGSWKCRQGKRLPQMGLSPRVSQPGQWCGTNV